ncbi:MAG: hypothetical protein LM590_11090 [Thermofilum sp.]|nr:hypothetical protein [Thermofilum sp.]
MDVERNAGELEGCAGEGLWGVSERAKVLVNKPRSLVAVWRKDYTRAYPLLGLLAAVAVFVVKARKRAPSAR